MILTIFTIFPDFFTSALKTSMLERAQKGGEVIYQVINIRDYATDKHHITDDRPYGGGPGMVMLVEPIDRALTDWKSRLPASVQKTRILLTSAKGKTFTQVSAHEYSQYDAVAIVCGHYEGVDERVAKYLVDEEVRIGDYVLTGGEPAALVITDAVTRLLPGVLGNAESTADESHSVPGQLGYPQYSRPAEYNGWSVPPLLLGGNHAAIHSWRNAQKKHG